MASKGREKERHRSQKDSYLKVQLLAGRGYLDNTPGPDNNARQNIAPLSQWKGLQKVKTRIIKWKNPFYHKTWWRIVARALNRFNLLISTAAKHISKASGSKFPISPETELVSNCVAALLALKDLSFLLTLHLSINLLHMIKNSTWGHLPLGASLTWLRAAAWGWRTPKWTRWGRGGAGWSSGARREPELRPEVEGATRCRPGHREIRGRCPLGTES